MADLSALDRGLCEGKRTEGMGLTRLQLARNSLRGVGCFSLELVRELKPALRKLQR